MSVAYDRLDPSLGLTPDLRLTNLRLVGGVAVGLWCAACLAARRWPRAPRRVAVPLGIWLVVLLASAWLAPSYHTRSLAFVRDIAFGMGVGWATYDLAYTRVRQLTLGRALALGGAGVAVLGLGEAARLGPLDDWLAGFKYQSFSFGELQRVSSTLPHPNIAATMLELTLPLLVVWAVVAHSPWTRAGLGLGVLAGLACLVLTLSRSGVVVTLAMLGAMAAVGASRRQSALLQSSGAAAGSLVVLVVAGVASNPLLALHLTSEALADVYGATYSAPSAVSARPGESVLVPIQLSNTGLRTWQATGDHPFALSYHLYQPDRTPVTYDGARTRMPGDIPPGGVVDLRATINAPVQPGDYVVEWDAVQESATWFSWTGVPADRTRLTVAGEAVSSTPPVVTAVPDLKAVQPTPSRLQLWRMALRMARHLPLLGVGPDSFRWVYGDYAQVTDWDTGVHANNLYVEWLADTGVLGLGTFVWFVWQLGRTLVGSLRSRDERASSGRVDRAWLWQLALTISLGGWFLHGLTDYFYEPLGTNLAFWLLAGLALAGADRLRQRRVGGV